VTVPAMQRTIVSKLRRGTPAQFTLMALNNRCSIGFHLEQPGG